MGNFIVALNSNPILLGVVIIAVSLLSFGIAALLDCVFFWPSRAFKWLGVITWIAGWFLVMHYTLQHF